MVRSWGWWTQHKLDILQKYLQVFVTASKRLDERIYLDLFAGWPENVSRETNEPILGSVHRALAVDPPFTRVCLFELPVKARRLEAALRERYPNHPELKVYPGDSNVTIDQALRDLARAGLRWAPTFTFIDQYASEIHWSTLQKISRFKEPHLTKAEMWILFGTSFYPRGLRLQQQELNSNYGARLSRMFGSDEWCAIIEGRRCGLLSPEQTRAELVNLMRWRLHHALGYKHSLALTVRNTNGSDLYDMIFVTDHPVGRKVMTHLYGNSPVQQDALRRYALEVRRTNRRSDMGLDPLFDVQRESFVPVGEGHEQAVTLEPPHEPFRLSR